MRVNEDEIIEHYDEDSDMPKEPEKKVEEEHKAKSIHHEKKIVKVLKKKKPEKVVEISDDEPKKSSAVTIVSVIAVILIIGLTLLIVFWQDIFKSSAAPGVAAAVNGEQITYAELEYNYNLSVPASFRSMVSEDVYLNKTLIPQVLLLQEAKKQNIDMTDAEVDAHISDLLAQSGLTQTAFEAQIAKDGFTMADVHNLYKTRLIIGKLLNASIDSQITVTDSDIQNYYDKNPTQFVAQPGQIRAAHILVATEAEAKDILSQLKKGADFAKLAMNKSIDTGSAQRGGDLGLFTKDQMVPEFANAAFNLSVGQLSGIVKSQYGYHIIKRLPDAIPLVSVREEIRQALISGKQNAALDTYLNQLRSTADIKIYYQEQLAQSSAVSSGVSTGQGTFTETSDPVCTQDGKPIIRLYSTTVCPHCQWIKATFDRVATEYVDQGKIVAHHYQLDTGDDALTSQVETKIPKEEVDIYQKYSPGGVPTFVFGCKYVRIGNGYESSGDLKAEEAEFRQIIDKLTATA
jgi:foldase protein PrsA